MFKSAVINSWPIAIERLCQKKKRNNASSTSLLQIVQSSKTPKEALSECLLIVMLSEIFLSHHSCVFMNPVFKLNKKNNSNLKP